MPDLTGCVECGDRIECRKCGEMLCPLCLPSHEKNCQEGE